MRKIIIFIISAAVLLLTKPSSVSGQEVSLGIWPPILQVMIQPGKGVTQVYKISNFGDPVIMSSSVAPFTASDETGNVSLVDCQKVEVIGCESLGWFSFQNANLSLGQSFFLGSGRTQEVVLKISVPEEASEGDYYNTLLFTTQAPLGQAELKSRVSTTIGSNILITVSKDGNPLRNIEIKDFTVKKKFLLPVFDSFDQIPVVLRVQNTGTAYTAVSGRVDLDGFPGFKASYNIPSQNILAGSTRLLIASPSAELSATPNNLYSFILPKAFYFGRYRLVAEIENQDGKIIKTSTYFFALPLKIIFLVLIILGISTALYKGSTLIRKRKTI